MRRLISAGFVVAALAWGANACTVGQGQGSVTGNLTVPNCDKDLTSYDMGPDFFAANAVNGQMTITIQKGGDYAEYADSVTIVVQDIAYVYDHIQSSTKVDGEGRPYEEFPIQLERPPGSAPDVPPPIIRMSLSLRGSCGSHKVNPSDEPQIVMHATGGVMRFYTILHGDIGSRDTNSKLIDGKFTGVPMSDPRGWGTLPTKGTLDGSFHFFYQRGGPAQPFP